MEGAQVRAWAEAEAATEEAIRRVLDAEGLRPYPWSNRPGDVYGAHTHPYHKVIYVLHGAITFGFPADGSRDAASRRPAGVGAGRGP